MDPVAKARAIAAKLAGISAPAVDVLGKRKYRFDEDENNQNGGGVRRKKKVYIPIDKFPDVNFMGLLIGPRGSNQKRMEEASGARILIRGRGSYREPMGDPDENDDMHVLLTADSDQAIELAQLEVEKILFNPEEAMNLKREQLRTVAELNGTFREDYDPTSAMGPGTYGPGTYGGGASSHETTVHMDVPKSLVGYIIGRGGETIRDLQANSGARVQVVRETEENVRDDLRIVSISGPDEAIESAKALLQNLINERMNANNASSSMMMGGGGGSSIYGGDAGSSTKVTIPNDKVGLVIGRSGMTVKAIQQRTGANVSIPNAAEASDPMNRVIEITGSDTAQAQAKAEILDIIAGGYQFTGQNTPGTTMQIPNDKVGIVIGRKGETIRGIQDRSSAKIMIPNEIDPQNPTIRTITLNGTPEAIEYAKYEIEMLLADHGGQSGGYTTGQQQQYGSTAGHYGAVATAGHYGEPQAQPQYDYSQYYAQTQQQQQQPYVAATVDPAAAAAAGTTGAEATASSATAVDPYWNGYYEYAEYYGVEAANTAWGVTTPATEPAPAVAVAPNTTSSSTTEVPATTNGPPGV